MAPKVNVSEVVYGLWGSPTATIDWCEDNYELTQYIAEFWNTLSNVFMILPSFVAAFDSWHQKFERRQTLCFLFLGLVGMGSTLFHMTLTYEMQLLDELPMIWGSLMLL
jgi:dihydroceramidase